MLSILESESSITLAKSLTRVLKRVILVWFVPSSLCSMLFLPQMAEALTCQSLTSKDGSLSHIFYRRFASLPCIRQITCWLPECLVNKNGCMRSVSHSTQSDLHAWVPSVSLLPLWHIPHSVWWWWIPELVHPPLVGRITSCLAAIIIKHPLPSDAIDQRCYPLNTLFLKPCSDIRLQPWTMVVLFPTLLVCYYEVSAIFTFSLCSSMSGSLLYMYQIPNKYAFPIYMFYTFSFIPQHRIFKMFKPSEKLKEKLYS